MKNLVFCILAALVIPSFPLSAQSPQVEEAVRKAQGGDLKGAIALLEPLKGQAGVHPSVLSLLGTLYLEDGRIQDSLTLLIPLADKEEAGPVLLHNAARAALALGDTRTAKAWLQRAVAKAPVSPAARALGILYGSEGRVAESYSLLRPWVLAHPDDQEARLSAAYGAIELDRPPEAEEFLKDLPDTPHVRLLRGRLQLLRRTPRAGLDILRPLLKDAPKELDISIRRFSAEAHLALGESAEAINLLQGKTGDDPSLALLLARAYYQGGTPEKAAAVLEEPLIRDFLAREPATDRERRFAVSIAREYGQSLVGLARWADAIPVLEKATRLNPLDIEAWQLLGRAQLASGRREDATRSMEEFRKLQSAQKSNSERVNEIDRAEADPTGRNLQEATALVAAGRNDDALAVIRQEIGFVPNDPRPRILEVTTLLAAKRPEEALKAAEAAVAAGPDNPDYLHLRGAARLALRQLPEAEKDLRQAIQAKPGHVGAMNDLAALLISAGRKDEARELLRKVLAVKPGDPVATATLKSLSPS
ncbi:MAG TPA: tetratricopeptide repeat protein [Thermoanaerobaculia bacterium]|nr:tetratricopeptide repeat protein [Thermoanaerobaculia bacterium]